MNAIFKRLFIIACASFSIFSLDAVFTRIVKYSMLKDGVEHTVFLCADNHVDFKFKPLRYKQADGLIDAGKKFNVSHKDSKDGSPLFLVEDELDYSGKNPVLSKIRHAMQQAIEQDNRHLELLETLLKTTGKSLQQMCSESSCDSNEIKENRSPINFLVSRCKSEGLNACNVDFRLPFQAYSQAQNIKPSQVREELEGFFNSLHKDMKHLETATADRYAQCIFAHYGLFWRDFMASYPSTFDIFASSKGVDQKLMATIALFDNDLNNVLDLNTLVELYKNRLRRNIFICCGEGHIEKIEPVIVALGYQKRDEQGKHFGPMTSANSYSALDVVKSAVNMQQFFAGRSEIKAAYDACRTAMTTSKQKLNIAQQEQKKIQEGLSNVANLIDGLDKQRSQVYADYMARKQTFDDNKKNNGSKEERSRLMLENKALQERYSALGKERTSLIEQQQRLTKQAAELENQANKLQTDIEAQCLAGKALRRRYEALASTVVQQAMPSAGAHTTTAAALANAHDGKKA